MPEDLDKLFGTTRKPSRIEAWEKNRVPRSLCDLGPKNSGSGQLLESFRAANNNQLFEGSGRCITLIWAMNDCGDIKIAVEEIAELPDGSELTGHPRRRNYPRHPAEEKKLGHPCLVGGNGARIAGELFLDRGQNGDLCWFVNVNSGRYCRSAPPSKEQVANVVDWFTKAIGQKIELDEI